MCLYLSGDARDVICKMSDERHRQVGHYSDLSSKLAQVIEQIPKDVLYDFCCSYAQEFPFRKGTKGYVHFFGAKKRNQRNIHPHQGLSLYGEDAIDYGQKPPCVKVLVRFTKLSP